MAYRKKIDHTKETDNRPAMFSLVMVKQAREYLDQGIDSHTTLAALKEFAKVKHLSIMETPIDDATSERIAANTMRYILG